MLKELNTKFALNFNVNIMFKYKAIRKLRLKLKER